MKTNILKILLSIAALMIVAGLFSWLLSPIYDCEMIDLKLYDRSTNYQMCVRVYEHKQLMQEGSQFIYKEGGV